MVPAVSVVVPAVSVVVPTVSVVVPTVSVVVPAVSVVVPAVSAAVSAVVATTVHIHRYRRALCVERGYLLDEAKLGYAVPGPGSSVGRATDF